MAASSAPRAAPAWASDTMVVSGLPIVARQLQRALERRGDDLARTDGRVRAPIDNPDLTRAPDLGEVLGSDVLVARDLGRFGEEELALQPFLERLVVHRVLVMLDRQPDVFGEL